MWDSQSWAIYGLCVCVSLLLSLLPFFLSLSLLPFLPLSLSFGPGPPLQSQWTQDTSQQDLAPEPGTATGWEVFTQKSLAASPEVTAGTSLLTQNHINGLKKTLSLGCGWWARLCHADGSSG